MYSSLQPRWQLSLRAHTGSIAAATALQPHQESHHPPGSYPEEAPCPLPSESRASGHRVTPKVHSVGNSGWEGREGVKPLTYPTCTENKSSCGGGASLWAMVPEGGPGTLCRAGGK